MAHKRQKPAGDIPYEIVCDILSRLRVKTLMRFKCVCKHWKVLIEQDKYLHDLHLTRSKTRQCLLINVPPKGNRNCFLAADLLSDGTGQAVSAAVHTMVPDEKKQLDWVNKRILGPVNGLICLCVGTTLGAIRIWNISTQQVSPPIKSTLQSRLLQQVSGDYMPKCHLVNFAMGFSPATKEHKVIFIWRIHVGYFRQPKVYYIGDVLTVGDNTWRKIDEAPQYNIQVHGASVYAEGVIYFATEMLKDKRRKNDKFIVAFDVDTEKFRSIKIPSFVLYKHTKNYSKNSGTDLMEVNGCLGLLTRISAFKVKLWLYNSAGYDQNWSEVAVELCHHWGHAPEHRFYSMGTDQIISHYCPGYRATSGSLYSYNLKNKTNANILVSGIPKSGADFSRATRVITYVESLSRVK